jgi:predicted Zn-dependent peptidase
VVRNERRQTSENTPYGKVELRLPELLYPKGHPYHHPVIGSHEDLEAATVSDVKQFFEKWYDPANASIVVAGDVDPVKTKATAEKWFGTIASRAKPRDPGAPGSSDQTTTEFSRSGLSGVVRETLEDDVELPKIVMAWQSPKHFGPGDAELDLAATALGTGKASRLYKALVYDQKIAQAVDASQEPGTLGSRFTVSVLAKPGVDLAKLEAAVDKELAAMRAAPIKDEELTRAKNLVETAFIARLQGVKDRAALLNMYEAEVKDPGYAQKDLARYRDATKDAVMATVAKVLVPDARVILRVVPRAKAKKESPTKEMKK